MKTNLMKYIKRIISAPFIFALLVITHNWFVIKRTLQFIYRGGEVSIYGKNDLKTIQDLYKLLRKNKAKEMQKYLNLNKK